MEKINIQTLKEQNKATLMNKNIALIYDISELKNTPIINVQSEGFIVAYILKGEAQIVVDDESYHVGEGDVFACMPRNILEKSMISMDLDARAIFVAPEYIEEITKFMKIDWSIRILASEHKVIHQRSEDKERIIAYFELVKTMLKTPSSPNMEQALLHVLVAMTFEFYDSWQEQNQQMPEVSYSTTETLFMRFVKMLADPNHKFVSVNEYAEELCVTPKYFSSVCKKLTGKTASEIINEEIIKQAQMMLREKNKSIKQIADALGFANQSHFGTFFRRHVGVSPQHFR